MCTQDQLTPLAAFVRNKQPRCYESLRTYPEVVNVFLKKYKTDQAIAIYDAAILRSVQKLNMTPQPFADISIAMSYKGPNLYDESTLNDVFKKGVCASISHSLSIYWSEKPQADITDIPFPAESQLSIKKGSKNASATSF